MSQILEQRNQMLVDIDLMRQRCVSDPRRAQDAFLQSQCMIEQAVELAKLHFERKDAN